MALIQKYSDAATTKTHGLVDGTLTDLINPSVALSATGEFMRVAAVGAIGWVARGKKEGMGFGF
jgi:hypothetical protein